MARYLGWVPQSERRGVNASVQGDSDEPLRDRYDSYEPRAETPAVGSTWIWEPDKSHAREQVTVREVRWNGEEWWVLASVRETEFWNDLSRFWEACVPDPDPNDAQVGEIICWQGRPSFAKALPSGWKPDKVSNMTWSRVEPDRWRRVA